MKILHCSDIHLGRRPVGMGEYARKRFEDYFGAFGQIVDAAIGKGVEVFLISGDLFDRRDLTPNVLERAENLLARLKDAGIPVILIEGNHDKVISDDTSWLVYLKNKGLARMPGCAYDAESDTFVFTPVEIGGVNFYGAGYSGAAMDKYLGDLARQLGGQTHGDAHTDAECAVAPAKDSGVRIQDSAPTANRECNIVLAHTAAGGGNFIPGLVREEDIDKLKGLAMYFAGGHIHYHTKYPKGDPFFFTPGSAEYWDIAERTGGKGFIVFDTESRRAEFFETEKRAIVLAPLFKCNSATESEMEAALIEHINALSIKKGEDIVIAEIECAGDSYVDTDFLTRAIEKAGALRAKVVLKYTTEDGATAVERAGNIEAIEKNYIQREFEHFSRYGAESAAVLREMKKLQEEGRYEDFKAVFDSFLDTFTGGAEERRPEG